MCYTINAYIFITYVNIYAHTTLLHCLDASSDLCTDTIGFCCAQWHIIQFVWRPVPETVIQGMHNIFSVLSVRHPVCVRSVPETVVQGMYGTLLKYVNTPSIQFQNNIIEYASICLIILYYTDVHSVYFSINRLFPHRSKTFAILLIHLYLKVNYNVLVLKR